ncbi:MAG: PQQ-dependent sugar dehydrogenase [Bacteroidota bacterium]
MKTTSLNNFLSLVVLLAVLFSIQCSSQGEKEQSLPLDQINLPEGFTIDIYAHVPNARSMVLSDRGTLFVGNRSEDKVYAVQDKDGDKKADNIYVVDEGLKTPNGVAIKDGDLYVAEINRILKYKNIESSLTNPPEPEVIYDGYPTEKHHGWKYIAFGPDGMLYVPVGAPCNICLRDDNPVYASITRIDVNNPKPEVVAHGVRNTVGFDWDRKTGKLWFTDNGRDMMGDDIPPCELNVVNNIGQHYGFPFCHGGTILDPEFGRGKSCNDYVTPAWNFVAHTAPLGMTFYEGDMFPGEYNNQIFAAQHGSWNRSSKVGYRVMLVKHNGDSGTEASVFASGWLDDATQDIWGRPVDVINMKDGSILISDDFAGVIYRVSYNE